ncbi:hypothetical protein [Janthinobacterium sp. HH100]|uniref:hypothetical protein n=1 Tax=Janthinobacterium sp. HH100 TaxID=1537272 RepID=UPI0015860B9F|nr:hypothetical protein [Janthinobacterium sp. HH100]
MGGVAQRQFHLRGGNLRGAAAMIEPQAAVARAQQAHHALGGTGRLAAQGDEAAAAPQRHATLPARPHLPVVFDQHGNLAQVQALRGTEGVQPPLFQHGDAAIGIRQPQAPGRVGQQRQRHFRAAIGQQRFAPPGPVAVLEHPGATEHAPDAAIGREHAGAHTLERGRAQWIGDRAQHAPIRAGQLLQDGAGRHPQAARRCQDGADGPQARRAQHRAVGPRQQQRPQDVVARQPHRACRSGQHFLGTEHFGHAGRGARAQDHGRGLAETVQAAIRGNPDIAFIVVAHGADEDIAQAIARQERFRVAADAQLPRRQRAGAARAVQAVLAVEPQGARAVDQHAAAGAAGIAVNPPMIELLVAFQRLDDADAAHLQQIDAAVRSLLRRRAQIEPADGRREARLRRLPYEQAFFTEHGDAAIAVGKHGGRLLRRVALRRSHRLPAPAIEARDAGHAGRPHGAVAADGKAPDGARLHALRLGIIAHHAILDVADAAHLPAYPHAAVGGALERQRHRVGKAALAHTHGLEAQAVETAHARMRAQPQETVMALCHDDDIVGRAVTGRPARVLQLMDTARGIDGQPARTGQHEHQPQQEGAHGGRQDTGTAVRPLRCSTTIRPPSSTSGTASAAKPKTR